MKKVAITQSNYIPWKGYFDLINSVDEFVLYDCVQYTRRDWRNRNLIILNKKVHWLTIPVEVKGKYTQNIEETKIAENGWNVKHLKTLYQAYGKLPYYEEVVDILEPVYSEYEPFLSTVNYKLITSICNYLDISTSISMSNEYEIIGGRNKKLIEICKQLEGDFYLSGVAAREYIKPDLFLQEGIEVIWMTYENYLPYKQEGLSFENNVSILDLLFRFGKDTKLYMNSFMKEGIIDSNNMLKFK